MINDPDRPWCAMTMLYAHDIIEKGGTQKDLDNLFNPPYIEGIDD